MKFHDKQLLYDHILNTSSIDIMPEQYGEYFLLITYFGLSYMKTSATETTDNMDDLKFYKKLITDLIKDD